MSDKDDKKPKKKPAQNSKNAPKKASRKKTAPKKAVKKRKSPTKSKKTKEDKLLEAIKTQFSGIRGRIDMRFLWEDGGRKRYRLNWYTYEGELEHSEFVHVIETKDKIKIISQEGKGLDF